MSETPSWLQGGNDAPAPASSSLEVSAPAPSPGLEPASSTSNGASDDDKELPGVILTMRLLNMGMAGGIVTAAVFSLMGIPSVSTFVLAIYGICGGLLICCLETQLKFLRVMIAVNFGFLFNSLWRFVFYLVLGSVCYSWDTISGRIMGYIVMGVAVFNTYVLCRYPSYRKMREKIAEEEDKRIEARISKEVKKQAMNQMMKK
mmetsp:Transcript_32902/g.94486  ORF Transcript_32902/g.94486 Transcript_32902/m.94486 type:complete len:203 (+) Transcript_32902:165-773(+)|eukprot:CAMPEP_0176004168 /NCGR_PEP_ID=MMETSP0120_2-20121206/1552_1 /TAXON_ID=160619 /ORGANISM="Kryptoperidinium foliaceum, Strain CCMP 1326" /LENGTH=202 /DNA_ID=CAMNT_0017336837 /DNA_START=53 /DNA_END=661 /DNA_ORIENTATION=+